MAIRPPCACLVGGVECELLTIRAPKRPVNLSLNEDLVARARGVVDNLSEVVESLLADFLSKEKARRDAHAKALKEAVRTWNSFGKKHGSFSDEHSTL